MYPANQQHSRKPRCSSWRIQERVPVSRPGASRLLIDYVFEVRSQ